MASKKRMKKFGRVPNCDGIIILRKSAEMRLIRPYCTALQTLWERNERCPPPICCRFCMNETQGRKAFSDARRMISYTERRSMGEPQHCQRTYMFILYANGTRVSGCWIQDRNLSQVTEATGGKRSNASTLQFMKFGKSLGGQTLNKPVSFGFWMCETDLIYAIAKEYTSRCQSCIQRYGFQLERRTARPSALKGYAYSMMQDVLLCKTMSKGGMRSARIKP